MSMKSRFSVLLVLLAFGFFVFQSDVSAQTGAAKGKGRVRGTVKDPQGKGIPDVMVKFSSSRLATSFDVKTNEKGEWAVAGVAGGEWDLDFQKDGFETRKISVVIQQLNYNKPVDMVLAPAQGGGQQAAPAQGGTGQPAAAPKPEADPAKLLLGEANTLAENKDYAGAIAKYEQAIQMNPQYYLVYGDIANLYMRNNQPDKALEAYNKLLEKDPTNGDARLAAAELLMEQNQADKAKEMLSKMDWTKVTNPNTVYNLGVRFYNAKQNEEAVKYFEKAAQLDPNMADAWLQVGVTYYALKQNDKAKEAFQKAVSIDPNSDAAKQAQEMLATMQ